MRTLSLRFFPLIIVFMLAAPNLSARGAWSVVSTTKLDPRIVAQLEDLARRDDATVRYLLALPEPTRAAGPKNLVIEFRAVENLDAFLATLKRDGGEAAKDLTREAANDGYTLSVASENFAPPYRISIAAASPRGFHDALLRVPQILSSRQPRGFGDLTPSPRFSLIESMGRASQVAIADFPSFPERGIVEGFYGKPWSHQDRLAMLRFEGQHAMNVYYYAPKDDPFHRALWRKPYPPAQMKRLGELVDMAHANFVDFCFAISPGLSMTYSSDSDFTDLTNKLDAVQKLGVSCFALFLDDVPQELQSPQDKARFKTLAEAHVALTNKLYHYLKSQSSANRLVLTPTTYTNEWGSQDYVRELGGGVDPNVSIVWTGTKVVSPTITVAQAEERGELLHRKPLVWDNFPVNDGIPWRVNLGPMRGRDPELPAAVSGLVSNPMVQPHASMIPLQTVAEYLWNSSAYDPSAAERRAVEEQYGKDAMKRLEPFLATYSDYWWDENIFRPVFVEERGTIDVPEIKKRIMRLQTTIRALRGSPRYHVLMNELAPFPGKVSERLVSLLADAAFRHQPDQKLLWRNDYDVLYAPRVSSSPILDGDFTKWQGGPLYVPEHAGPVSRGDASWRRVGDFSSRFALGWDDGYLYVGADVTDPNLYQPFSGRDIAKGDFVSLILETAFHRNFESTSADGDEYELLFSPGDFAETQPGVYSDDEYRPPRPIPRDYSKEIKMAWKKTAQGFSADVAIPVAWFDGGKFSAGYEIGMNLAAQKALPKPSGSAVDDEKVPHMIFSSKTDRFYPARYRNPSTYQRLVLVDSKTQQAR